MPHARNCVYLHAHDRTEEDTKPWLNFEAGAIGAKVRDSSLVMTVRAAEGVGAGICGVICLPPN
jgi:hypothetical protein